MSRKASPSFKKVVPLLIQNGFHVAICTHCDEIFHKNRPEFDRRTSVAGTKYVNIFLEETFGNSANGTNIPGAFSKVCFNPLIHKLYNPTVEIRNNKVYHMKKLVGQYKYIKDIDLKMNECLLFDDSATNVKENNNIHKNNRKPEMEDPSTAADAFYAVQVNPKEAFSLTGKEGQTL